MAQVAAEILDTRAQVWDLAREEARWELLLYKVKVLCCRMNQTWPQPIYKKRRGGAILQGPF